MKKLLSCDWGTSAFRLRLIDSDTEILLAELASAEGISVFFEKWKQTGRGEEERLSFYQSFLLEQINVLEKQLKSSLQDIPLVISGMASSRIGMAELPYKRLPFSIASPDLVVKTIAATNDFRHETILISGAMTENDIMRGEETLLIGCNVTGETKELLFIFPGTHSKHVRVKEGLVIDIRTYMTGEFFALLSQKSILATDVEENEEALNEAIPAAFEKGVRDSLHLNILNSSFSVRAHHLLGKSGKKDNYHYLSGLLIGTELKELVKTDMEILLVSSGQLANLYKIALQVLGLNKVEVQDADEAIIKGHCKLLAF